jgi:hypothetical protein
MVSAINPLGTMYSVSLSNIGDKSTGLTKAIANNVSPDISTFHSIFSRQLNASAIRGAHIVENLGIGYSLTSTALSTLNSLSEQLETIKNTIMSLDNASPQLLDIQEENYTSQIRGIFDTLANTDFNGKKLFDGTLANAPVPRLPSQNLPDNAGSLLIETSINSQSYVNITIPRLLSGDGTIVNAPVDGVFDPLFPVTNNTRSALAKLDAVLPTAVNTDTTGGAGNWDGLDITGSYGDQLRLIDLAIPAGVNVEQDMIRSVVISSFNYYASTYNVIEDNNTASKTLIFAKAVGKTITLSQNNNQDVINALNVVQAGLNTIVGGDSLAQGLVKIQAITHDNTVSYAQQIFQAVAEASFRTISVSTAQAQAGFIKQQLNNIINNAAAPIGVRKVGIPFWDFQNNIQSRTFPNPIYIGNIKTLSGRVGAMKMIDNAIRSINNASAQVTGQRDIIVTNTGVLKQNIIDLVKSADSISSADYEKIIPMLTELLRSVTVLSVAFGLEEEFIETIINRLDFIGNQ